MFQHLIKQKLIDQSRNLNNEFTLIQSAITQNKKEGSSYSLLLWYVRYIKAKQCGLELVMLIQTFIYEH